MVPRSCYSFASISELLKLVATSLLCEQLLLCNLAELKIIELINAYFDLVLARAVNLLQIV